MVHRRLTEPPPPAKVLAVPPRPSHKSSVPMKRRSVLPPAPELSKPQLRAILTQAARNTH
jgi:hypothetical protein